MCVLDRGCCVPGAARILETQDNGVLHTAGKAGGILVIMPPARCRTLSYLRP